MSNNQTTEVLIKARDLTQAAFNAVSKHLEDIEKQTEGVGNKQSWLSGITGGTVGTLMKFGAAGAGIGIVSSALSKVGDAAMSMVTGAIDMNAQLEESTMQFTGLMGSSEKARAHVASLFEFAKRTPFETGPIITASKHLQVFGGDALNTEKTLTLLGDASANVGAPINELGFWVGRLYSQIAGGKPFGEAAMRLTELAVMSPKARDEMERLQRSGASADEVFKVFTTSLEGHEGAMVRMASSWTGLASTLTDAGQMMIAEALEPFFGTAKEGLATLVDVLGDDGVSAAWTTMAETMKDALGGDSQGLIRTLGQTVLWLVDVSLSGVDLLGRGFYVVKTAILGVLTGVVGAAEGLTRVIASLLESASELPGVGDSFKGVGETVRSAATYMTGMRESLAQQTKEAASAVAGNNGLSAVIGKMHGVVAAADKALAAATTRTREQGQAAAKAATDTASLTTATGKAGGAVEAAAKLQKAFTADMDKLAAALTLAEKNHVPLTKITEEYGQKIEDTIDKARTFGRELPAIVQQTADRIRAARFQEAIAWQPTRADIDGFRRYFAEVENDVDQHLGRVFDQQRDLQDRIFDLTANETDKRLRELDREREAELRKLGQRTAANGRFWDEARAQIDAHYQHEREIATGSADTIVERMRRQGIQTREELQQTADKAKADYDQMRAAGVFTAEQVQDAFQRWQDAQQEASGNMRASWTSVFEDLNGLVQQFASGSDSAFGRIAGSLTGVVGSIASAARQARESGAGGWGQAGQMWANADSAGDYMQAGIATAGGVIQGYQDIKKATDIAGRGNRALAGAAAGAKAGMMFGPYGAAIGAGVGAIVGAVRNPGWEQIMKRVGKDWGVQISEALGRKIEETAKSTFRKDKMSAEVYHLADILNEAGGLTDENVDKFEGKLRDVFSMVEMGKFTAEQARTVLDEAFPAFAKRIEESGGLASKTMLHVLALNDQFGTQSAAVAQFVGAQASSAMGGLSTFLEHATVGSADAAQAMGASVGAAFGVLRSENVSVRDALASIQPMVLDLSQRFQLAGYDGGEAFNKVASMANVMADTIVSNGVTAIGGLGQTLKGLHNSGLMNQDMFRGLAGQIGITHKALIDQGKDGAAIMQLIQPELQTIWQLQKDFGYEVDETTQAMLDEAEAAGLVGEKHQSAEEKMVDGIGKVVTKLDELLVGMGIKLPDAIESGVDRATGSAKKLGSGFDEVLSRIPKKIEIGVGWDVDKLNVDGTGGDGVVRGAQAGGLFERPTFRVIGEREPEIVGSPNIIVDALAQAMSRSGFTGGAGGGDIYIALDPSTGRARRLHQSELQQIQQAMASGLIKVPRDAIVSRAA